ncbi:MAG: hypothetical protein M3R25_15895, partial [Bacteroidota bacterium]|nr:hypothetical protein [Bacteroidota bacterium]
MVKTYTGISFLRHLLQSTGWSRFHSPYLFQLFQYCCDEKNTMPEFEMIEEKRRQLRASNDVIVRRDYGAGSLQIRGSKQRVSSIASHALSLQFQCRFMARLAKFTTPDRVLELG